MTIGDIYRGNSNHADRIELANGGGDDDIDPGKALIPEALAS